MELTPQQWENVKKLFEEALDRPPDERVSFLAAAAPDPEVKREVGRLLVHHVESGGFLSRVVIPGAEAGNRRTRDQSRGGLREIGRAHV